VGRSRYCRRVGQHCLKVRLRLIQRRAWHAKEVFAKPTHAHCAHSLRLIRLAIAAKAGNSPFRSDQTANKNHPTAPMMVGR
jgi:hypothetical protein